MNKYLIFAIQIVVCGTILHFGKSISNTFDGGFWSTCIAIFVVNLLEVLFEKNS